MLKPKTLRRLLGWPLIWRWAADRIIGTVPHSDGVCLHCDAQNKRFSEIHLWQMNTQRQMFCKKCGLPVTEWQSRPRCKGEGPKPPVEQPNRPDVIVFPVAW